MKKILAFLCISLLFSTVSAYAQTVSNEEMGISFTLSGNWQELDYDSGLRFQNQFSSDESIEILCVQADGGYSMDFIEEAALQELCETIYSNAEINRKLSEANNTIVTVSVDSVLSSYEYHNNTLYYRYEKAYTAHAFGFYDTPFYDTIFVTAKNGNVYLISYQRNSQENHFAEVADMLNTLSFEPGEIKILINGERIYPDSAPMLIEDRTLVPIRAVAEKMGYNVAWDEAYQLVTLISKSDSTILHFAIGEYSALKNFTTEIVLDVPPIIIGDRTYLPLRAVAEAMDASVNWNEEENAVQIQK